MNSFMQRGIGGSTAIGAGLAKGIEAIRGAGARPYAVRNIVLMTDGLHNTGVDPVTIARTAAAEDVVVFTVTFSQGGDQARMRQVAEETGGRHFHADTAADLRASFREIARTIPVLITD
jgi:Mg-chelatase subunit ChlD